MNRWRNVGPFLLVVVVSSALWVARADDLRTVRRRQCAIATTLATPTQIDPKDAAHYGLRSTDEVRIANAALAARNDSYTRALARLLCAP